MATKVDQPNINTLMTDLVTCREADILNDLLTKADLLALMTDVAVTHNYTRLHLATGICHSQTPTQRLETSSFALMPYHHICIVE